MKIKFNMQYFMQGVQLLSEKEGRRWRAQREKEEEKETVVGWSGWGETQEKEVSPCGWSDEKRVSTYIYTHVYKDEIIVFPQECGNPDIKL